MADPTLSKTRRAVLGYDHLKRLFKQGGFDAPDLFVKDYQGIGQDFALLANGSDSLEERVLQNELAIADLDERVTLLEERVFDRITTVTNMVTDGFQIIKCINTSGITVILNPSAKQGEEVHIKRRGADVLVVGTIDGLENINININRYSMHLVRMGDEWIEI